MGYIGIHCCIAAFASDYGGKTNIIIIIKKKLFIIYFFFVLNIPTFTLRSIQLLIFFTTILFPTVLRLEIIYDLFIIKEKLWKYSNHCSTSEEIVNVTRTLLGGNNNKIIALIK